jgi:hypothetical protein
MTGVCCSGPGGFEPLPKWRFHPQILFFLFPTALKFHFNRFNSSQQFHFCRTVNWVSIGIFKKPLRCPCLKSAIFPKVKKIKGHGNYVGIALRTQTRMLLSICLFSFKGSFGFSFLSRDKRLSLSTILPLNSSSLVFW